MSRPRSFLTLTVVLMGVLAAGCASDASSPTASASSDAPSQSPTALTEAGTIQSSSLEGRILFTRAGGQFGDETVFTANADGTQAERITEFGSTCCPRWSPDGSHILFAATMPDGETITTAIVDPDGSHARQIPLPDGTMNLGPGAWSPDGTRIAFQGWDNTDPSRAGIYIGDSSDGGHLVRVTTNTEDGADFPGDFSPDGTQLVFLRERPLEQSVGQLFVVNVDGTDLHPITPLDLPVGTAARWSPDGTRILFEDARDQPQGYLRTVDPDGSHLETLFADPEGRFAIAPAWSPDGSYVMFALNRVADAFSHPANSIYVIRADGAGLTELIDTADSKRGLDWVPN